MSKKFHKMEGKITNLHFSRIISKTQIGNAASVLIQLKMDTIKSWEPKAKICLMAHSVGDESDDDQSATSSAKKREMNGDETESERSTKKKTKHNEMSDDLQNSVSPRCSS